MSDLELTRSKSRAVWGSGDFARIGGMTIIVGELLCEVVDLQAGERVLDVATGHGNTALSAARRFGEVTGVDLVPELLARARERASAEQLPITFKEGDAQALDFPDNHFDLVLSTFGCMFAPDQERTAAELMRVCRPGGRLGLAAWTPGGQTGALIQSMSQYMPPPPPGFRPPARWGTVEGLQALFPADQATVQTTLRTFRWRYHSVAHYVDFMTATFPPIVAAMRHLSEEQKQAFRQQTMELTSRFSQAKGDGIMILADYLEIVVTKR